MRLVTGWSLPSLSLVLVLGCGDGQTVDPGTNSPGQGGQATVGAGGSGGGAAGDGAGGDASGAGGDASGAAGTAGASAGGAAGESGAGGAAGHPAATGVVVNVVYDGTSRPVDLGTLPTAVVNGQTLASMADVWSASNTPVDLAKVQFDFEGDDGFRPSVKNACKTPITGAQLSKGYIDPKLRNLFWDDSLGLSGCYRVKGLAKMLASDAP